MEDLIYTLDGKEVINLAGTKYELMPDQGVYGSKEFIGNYLPLEKIEFKIDLSDPLNNIRIIESLDETGDAPFFYQLNQVLKKKDSNSRVINNAVIVNLKKVFHFDYSKSVQDNHEDGALRTYLPGYGVVDDSYADTDYRTNVDQVPSRFYTPSEENLVRDFFLRSQIEIRFPGQKDFREFILFDKSQSMARNSRILLIQKDLLSYYCGNSSLMIKTIKCDFISGINSEQKERIIARKLYDAFDMTNVVDEYVSDTDNTKEADAKEDLFPVILKEPDGSYDHIVRVVLTCKISDSLDIFLDENLTPKAHHVIMGMKDYDFFYESFYPIIENEDYNYLYYVHESLWNTIKKNAGGETFNHYKKYFNEKLDSYKEIHLDQRLNLGIDFHGIDITLSKFYAYRGLYLTTSKRIDPSKLILDKDTVVVIPDAPDEKGLSDEQKKNLSEYYRYEKCVSCITNENHLTKDKKISVNLFQADLNLCNNQMFDGEGLISPNYSTIVNKCLNLNTESFQIRLPFTKGMLHTVDFPDFLENYAYGKTTIKDFWGIKRDLAKAEIILTESMFKAGKWIQALLEKSGIKYNSNKEIWEKNDTSYDPMEIFFGQLEKYDHALYISGTDTPYKNRNLTYLNYQILNTLDINRTELDNVLEFHKKFIADPMRAVLDSCDAHIDNEEESSDNEECSLESDTEEDADYEKSDDTDESDYNNNDYDNKNNICEEGNISDCWMDVIKKDQRFRHHPYVKNKIKSMQNNRIADIAKGRLIVPGEVRYLSRDLLLFLKYILELAFLCNIDDKNEDLNNLLHKPKSELNAELLDADYFYAPGAAKNCKEDESYPIFRNPHLSRNEECILKACYPGKNSLRKRYLSELHGLIMVSHKSFVPQTLGGADFDGDLVKIVYDKSIFTAVERGIIRNGKKIPIIKINPDIENSPEADTPYTDKIDYTIIYNTFSNSIGLISNLAIQKGQKLYHPDFYGNTTNSSDLGINELARYTILTGLEIDACKSGLHPDLRDYKQKNKTPILPETSFDYLNSFLKKIRRLQKRQGRLYLPSKKWILSDSEGENARIIFLNRYGKGYWAPDYGSLKDDAISPLAYIAYHFLKGCKNPAELKEQYGERNIPDEPYYRVSFKLKKNIEKNIKKSIYEETLDEYKKEKDNLTTIKNTLLKKQKFMGAIDYILGYHYPDSILFGEKNKHIKNICASLNEILKSCEEDKSNFINGIIEKLNNSEWPYMFTTEQKDEELKALLHINGDIPECLRDMYRFDIYGYNLLYLFLVYAKQDVTLMEISRSYGYTKLPCSKDIVMRYKERFNNLATESGIDMFPLLYKSCSNGYDSLIWNIYSADTFINNMEKYTQINDIPKSDTLSSEENTYVK